MNGKRYIYYIEEIRKLAAFPLDYEDNCLDKEKPKPPVPCGDDQPRSDFL